MRRLNNGINKGDSRSSADDGYLHEGHASLAQLDRVVIVLSFPFLLIRMKFGPTEDLESYPRDFEHDCALLEQNGVDLVFHPEPEEMYAPDFCTWVDMDQLTKGLCGKTRPIHFRGVCTVVSKLLHIVSPQKAFFGQKDAQQLAVIRRMVRDLNIDVEIVGCPIVRESDGLAKSSRNTYLSESERRAALVLSQAVTLGEKLVAEGECSASKVVDAMHQLIEREPIARIDYVEAVDALEYAASRNGSPRRAVRHGGIYRQHSPH